jgi:hypothetical protein
LTFTVITHSIGGVTFRTEFNTPLPFVREELFELFRIDDVEPDVHQSIIKCVSCHALRANQASGQVEPSPSNPDNEKNEHPNSLLRSSFVQEKLRAYTDHPDVMRIELDQDEVVIRHFARREFVLIYNDSPLYDDPIRRKNNTDLQIASNFRRIFATFLPCFEAVLIHSSGVIVGDRVALFLAPSTGGKSTVASQADGMPKLSDDQVIIRSVDGTIHAYATPFGRLTSGPNSARLGGIFVLQKADYFELNPIPIKDIVPHLWSARMDHTWFLPKGLQGQVSQLLYSACRQVPAYVMHFPKGQVDWEAIDRAMV